ncbi:MAG: hypothetical protein WCJ14_11935 [Verrucomicrobiota bacterium]
MKNAVGELVVPGLIEVSDVQWDLGLSLRWVWVNRMGRGPGEWRGRCPVA